MFVPDQRLSEAANAMLRDESSSLEGDWLRDNPMTTLSAVFKSWGLAISGRTFMERLGGLAQSRGPVTGSWLDIVSPADGIQRRNHAWHQDSGLDQYTVPTSP